MEGFLILGSIVAIIGGVWMLILAFQESILIGLAYMFIPFFSIYFAITRWQYAKIPFIINLAGIALMLLGAAFADPDAASSVY